MFSPLRVLAIACAGQDLPFTCAGAGCEPCPRILTPTFARREDPLLACATAKRAGFSCAARHDCVIKCESWCEDGARENVQYFSCALAAERVQYCACALAAGPRVSVRSEVRVHSLMRCACAPAGSAELM